MIKRPKIVPSSFDWARLAAFIDGEGCICISKRKHENGKILTNLYVSVTNTNPVLMVWIANRFGGSVYENLQKSPKWTTPIKWVVSNKKAAEILRGCMEFFIVKSGQAKVGLAHQSLCFNVGNQGHADSVYERRMELRDELSLLKNTSSRRKDLRPESNSIQ